MKPHASICYLLAVLVTGFAVWTNRVAAQEDQRPQPNRGDSKRSAPAKSAAALPPDGLLGIAWAEDDQGKVILTKVAPDSPFAKIDARPGDVIVTVGGTPIRSGAALDRTLRNLRPKEEVVVQSLRGSQRLRGKIVVGESLQRRAGLFGSFVELDPAGRLVITEVAPDTSAAAAGLQPGDQIISIADNRPHSLEGLGDFARRLISTKLPGDRVGLRIVRNGQEHPIILVLPENTAAGAATAGTAGGSAPAEGQLALVLGIAVKERGTNLVVTDVIPNDPAAIAGIQRDDVIQAIGNQQTTSYATLVNSIKAFQPGDRVPVHILRGQKQGVLDVVAGAREAATADVVLNAADDIAEIVAEVKKLKAQVNELGQNLQQLSQEVNQLKQQAGGAAAQNAPR